MKEVKLSEEEVLEQWEPKVNSMLRNTSVTGLDREDIAQELRIAIIKAWRRYRPENTKAKFHTYLHVTMLNTIRTLMDKAKKHGIQVTSLDEQAEDYKDSPMSSRIIAALEDESQMEAFREIDLLSLLNGSKLTEKELDFLELRVQRYKLDEITEKLGTLSSRLRDSIRRKIEWGLLNVG